MLDEHNALITMLASVSQLHFPLLLKIGFVTLDPRMTRTNFAFYSKALYGKHAFSDMKIVHKIHIERFLKCFLSLIPIYKRHCCYREQNLVQWLK